MVTKKHTIIILTTLYFSLFVGIYINEDLIGGAFNDYEGHFHISEKFRNNFFYTFLNYDELGHRHSPFFYIFRSILPLNEILQRIFFLHIFLITPIFFYKSLKKIFKTTPKNNLKLLASLLLLFPTFRSYSIWSDPHLLGVLFFTISIYYFLKFKENKNVLKNSLLNTFFLALSAYSSPNFGIFVIYFFYEFCLRFSFSKNLILVIFCNFVLSIPFFYYLFYIDVNFIFNSNGWDIGKNFYSLNNVSNKIIIISSIFLFYLIPFIFSKNFKLKINNFLKFRPFNIVFLSIFLASCYFFDFTYSYNLTNSGGGFFYSLSKLIFQNDVLLFLISFFSFLLLINIFLFDYKNLILFVCLILSNPQITIWQANFSPTIFILIMLVFNLCLNKSNFLFKHVFVIYSYFLLYFGLNIVKILLL